MMTKAQVEALTDNDVVAARQKRGAMSTIDFVLLKVDGKARTLEMAKRHLFSIIDAKGSK